jgi:hypothetical protein
MNRLESSQCHLAVGVLRDNLTPFRYSSFRSRKGGLQNNVCPTLALFLIQADNRQLTLTTKQR